MRRGEEVFGSVNRHMEHVLFEHDLRTGTGVDFIAFSETKLLDADS